MARILNFPSKILKFILEMKINRKYAGKIRSIMIQNSSDVDSELIESESESAAESFQVLNLQYTVLQFQGGLFFSF